jgi:O-antigen/teichoic acid export membrane protein
VWRGAVTRGVATLLAKAASFAVTLLVVRRLAPGDAGSFFLALAAASTLGPVLSLGMAESVARVVPTLDVEGRPAESAAVVRSSLGITVATAAVAATTGGALSLAVAPSLVGWVVAVAGLAGLLALDAIAGAFLRARRRVVVAETLQAAAPVVFLGALVVASRAGAQGAERLFLLRAGLELAAAGGLVWIVLRTTVTAAARRAGRSVLGPSMPFWICGLVWLGLQNADVLILGVVKGSDAVAGYVPILRTADLTALTQGLFAAYVLPVAAAMHAAGRRDDVERVYLEASAYAFALSSPLIAVLALEPGTTVEVLLGHTSADGEVVARVLALAYGVNAVLCMGGVVVQAIGDVWELARRWVVVVVLTVLADVILIPWLGVRGAALGSMASLVALNATSSYLLYRRHRVTPFRPSLVAPVIGALAAMVALRVLVPSGGGVTALLVVGFVVGAVVGATAWVAASRDRARGAGRLADEGSR